MNECCHRWSSWYSMEDDHYRWQERVCLICGEIETSNYTTKK